MDRPDHERLEILAITDKIHNAVYMMCKFTRNLQSQTDYSALTFRCWTCTTEWSSI